MRSPRHLFNTTASVTRKTTSRDSGGSRTETFGAHLSGVPCRVRNAGASDEQRNLRLNHRIQFVCYMAYGTDIATTDRITVEGRTLDVIDVNDPHFMKRFLQIDCEESKGG